MSLHLFSPSLCLYVCSHLLWMIVSLLVHLFSPSLYLYICSHLLCVSTFLFWPSLCVFFMYFIFPFHWLSRPFASVCLFRCLCQFFHSFFLRFCLFFTSHIVFCLSRYFFNRLLGLSTSDLQLSVFSLFISFLSLSLCIFLYHTWLSIFQFMEAISASSCNNRKMWNFLQ